MIAKCVIFVVLAVIASANAGVLPAAAAIVAPYASSYNAHAINHAVATPVVAAAPYVAAPYAAAPYAAAPYAAAPYAAAPYAAAPALAHPALSAYSAFPGAGFVL